ncbi:NADP-dependent oxidoreductase [Micromonospora parathelypteridis]|uniref:NADPH:quinone reductase-like Zn-dependent oxidoreductase n=1 Tax=Micromonospora parathelypteridis TaxID=1839617 RepID=A0A840W982_9ACTN|nr:NADP-dependent oxidoreductase [Micromonospora parathelypteridis]MBB5481568.1 NADPH:quinone reductase-like Zn-dependent oxidoreductase [Micromonospora parathelypteridis]
MWKIVQSELGDPSVLRLIEADRPEPGPTEVLVEVRAAGVNPVDWKVRAHGGILGPPPFTVGWEISGVVSALGPGVTRFAVGDEVFGMPRFPKELAGYAEYVTAPARHLARTPRVMGQVEAGGLALGGLTAWQTLVETANVQPGQRVLIPGAAGGFGHLAVQVAKALGAYVIGTASAPKHDFVRGLGADEVVDYRSEDVGAVVKDVDLAIATVSGQLPVLAATLRPGGLIVALNSAEATTVRDFGGLFLLAEPDRAGLEALATLVDAGKLRVHVDRVFPLAEAAEAHRRGETGRTTGKLVLVP